MIRELHYNKPQLLTHAINAKETYVVAGRATGKSQGILAPHLEACLRKMPRSCGLLFGSSYRKMMTDLMPPLISGWERLGFIQDEDYTIGSSDIPGKKKWQDPYIAPQKKYRQFFLHSKYGSGIRLASQDRRVTMNGTEVDFIAGDEAKLLNFDRYKKEIVPSNRGRNDIYKGIPEHHSIWFCTDKLFDRKGGDWIMQMRRRVDPALIEMILQLRCFISDQMEKGADGKVIEALEKELAEAQCVAVAFIEASTLDNIHALGWDFIREQYLNLSEREFNVAILNLDGGSLEGGFYAAFDRNQHTKSGLSNYEKLDDLNFNIEKIKNIDCTFDTDVIHDKPLEISIDWGGSINSLIVCQETRLKFKVLKNMFTKPPQSYKHLARLFCDYYEPHGKKTVYMYYDPSGNNARADSNETYAQEFSSLLMEKGWNVILMNQGATNPHYEKKHLLIEMLLKEEDDRLPKLEINADNCEQLITSIENAGIRIGKSGWEKDKSSEDVRTGILPEHATHLSDGFDIIIYDKYKHILETKTRLSEGGM